MDDSKRFIFLSLFVIMVSVILNTLSIYNTQHHINDLYKQITQLNLEHEINSKK